MGALYTGFYSENILTTRENSHNRKKVSEWEKILSVKEIYKIYAINSNRIEFLKIIFKNLKFKISSN